MSVQNSRQILTVPQNRKAADCSLQQSSVIIDEADRAKSKRTILHQFTEHKLASTAGAINYGGTPVINAVLRVSQNAIAAPYSAGKKAQQEKLDRKETQSSSWRISNHHE